MRMIGQVRWTTVQVMWPLPECLPRAERRFRRPDSHFAADHLTFATRYNNHAHIVVAQGHIPEAVTLWRRAYAICLKALGPDHPYTKDDAAMLRKYDPPGP